VFIQATACHSLPCSKARFDCTTRREFLESTSTGNIVRMGASFVGREPDCGAGLAVYHATAARLAGRRLSELPLTLEKGVLHAA